MVQLCGMQFRLTLPSSPSRHYLFPLVTQTLLTALGRYVPETEEWLAQEGHWWENEAEPDMEQEVSMLASDFSDINVGTSADESDEQAVEGDREQDSSPASEEATELGGLFGPIDL